MATMSIAAKVLACLAGISITALAQSGPPKSIPDVSSHVFGGAVTTAPYTRPAQSTLTGQVQLAIKLVDPPLVVQVGIGAKQSGIVMTGDQQRAYLAQLKQKQDTVMSQIAGLGGVELGRVSKGHNAIMISIGAKQLPALHNIAGVIAVRPVADYATSSVNVNGQPDLPTTLAYLGGTAVQNSGITGQGVKI